jgi:hypothetical protein
MSPRHSGPFLALCEGLAQLPGLATSARVHLTQLPCPTGGQGNVQLGRQHYIIYQPLCQSQLESMLTIVRDMPGRMGKVGLHWPYRVKPGSNLAYSGLTRYSGSVAIVAHSL